MPREARIKKRSDGFYQRSITVGIKPDGKPLRKTFYAKTLKELEIKAADFERQLRHGILSSDEQMTFGELAAVWIKDYKPKISPTTRNMYQMILDAYLIPDLSIYKLKDLKSHHLQSIINRMAEVGRSESTLKKVKLTAVQVLKIAMDNDIIYRNVFEKVNVPSIEAHERRPLTEEEKNLITSTFKGHRMGIPALLMLFCGIRRGELIALTWNDISIQNKTLTVNKATIFAQNRGQIKSPKSKSGTRTIPIPDIILEPLKEARKGAGSTLVCPSASGHMMSLMAFNSAWRSYVHYLNIKAGGRDASRSRPKVSIIDGITPHIFRHTYATILYNAGVDIKSAQRFLGHADINVTLKIYTHLSEQKQKDAITALNRHLTDEKEQGKISDAVKMQ